ncbi:helix-turn-helix domain-containing protein [Streptomyces sp. OfavH-34-F]|uniref:helix-turn-helix transcriptional regulator n=1 Tax=Streptomyces sp. OfavH-34-F TaxID=2917760 RepID=UPI001EF3896F|nr:helix-turn-helix domain-containing protein [Streptomyces sp. OfavH-34-F]MCG7526406.1 helix-turn-helix domain-containing protein [Streptomyces sp. OfavH-34-F]
MTSDMTPPASPDDAAIDSLSALGEGTRRQMFSFIRRAHRPVTRDEAAAEAGISRKLAAFHLDKLVDAGLLRARYGSPTGVRKVGRQPKVYEPTDTPIRVSIPDRRHELLADLLIQAVVTEGADETAVQAAMRTAGRRGEELGEEERARLPHGDPGAERGLPLCERMLDGHGFEPTREGSDRLRLSNCPFHPLAQQAPDLVCGMNHAFLTGYLRGLQAPAVEAVLAPRPGECCVEIRQAPADDDTGTINGS